MPEQDNVNLESLPEGVEPEVSSPEAETQPTQETETPTPQEDETPEAEEQRVPYDRFKEKVDEANWYKQQLEQQMQQPKTQQPIQQPTTDPYAGMTAEEKVFWQQQRKIAREEAESVAKTKEAEYKAQFEQQQRVISNLLTRDFRREFPDVKRGSQEEQAIAKRISQGYPPDEAYKLEMWDKKVGDKKSQTQQTQQQRLEAKQKANVVSPQSISSQATPSGQKETFEEELRRKMNTDWNGEV